MFYIQDFDSRKEQIEIYFKEFQSALEKTQENKDIGYEIEDPIDIFKLKDVFSSENHALMKKICSLERSKFSRFTSYFKEINNILNQLTSFSLQNRTKGDKRTALNRIRTVLFQIINESGNIFLEGTDDISAYLSEASAHIEKIKSEIEEAKQEFQSILNTAQETTRNEGIEREHKIFSKESEGHDKKARSWLVTGCCFIVLLLIFLGYISYNEVPLDSWLALAKFSSLRILFASVLSYSIFRSMNNYLIHKHNSVVNNHRSNALKTFKVFFESTNNPQIKEAILLQATSCIFDHRETGYLKNSQNKGGVLENRTFSFLSDAKKATESD